MSVLKISEIVSPNPKEDQLFNKKINKIMESLSNVYNSLLSELTVDSIVNNKMEVNAIKQKVVKILKEYSKISSQNRTSLLSVADFCDILIQLIGERYNLLNDIFYCQNRITRTLSNVSVVKNDEPSEEVSFNIVTQSQIKRSDYKALRKCRHFNTETRRKLEQWYKLSDFSKEAIEKLSNEVNLDVVQIKNWVSNKKRKEKKAISKGIIDVSKTFSPSNVYVMTGDL